MSAGLEDALYLMYMHPEFWDSLETVADLHNISRTVTIALAMLVVVASILDYVMGIGKKHWRLCRVL